MIELDFVADGSPEYWNLTGAGATEEQSLHDLYPGRLHFTVNGTDLSPKALVPLLGVVAPLNQFLAAVPPPRSASWAPSDQLPRHAYTIQRIASGRVHLRASWSGSGTSCVEAAFGRGRAARSPGQEAVLLARARVGRVGWVPVVVTGRFRALPSTQSFQEDCQKPQPLFHSSSRSVPTTVTMSPRWERL